MAVTDYTTFDDVRAALGVSAEELDDATLSLDLYTHSLALEMSGISAELPAAYATVLDKAESARSAVELQFFSAVKAFAPYAVAKQLASSLPLFAPKTITDGKATVTRDSSAPFTLTIESCKDNYDRFRSALEAAYSAYIGKTTTAVLRPFFGASAPSSDPVTGT